MEPLTIIGAMVLLVILTLVMAVTVHLVSERRMHRKYGDVVRRHKPSSGGLMALPLSDKVGIVIAVMVAVPAVLFAIYALGK
jgi:hypothetical protein